KTIRHFLSYVNRFYLERLSAPKYSLLNIVSDITRHQARAGVAERDVLKIDALAKKHFTTERHLERQFNRQIGISPKEFINLTRFNKAFEKLQRGSKQTISTVAWESGYYDNAHLTNDFKRYTGKAPTEFFLSDFSKAVTSDTG
ncbi:MAG TPA: helix-turn-helix domain-containing protein, partial [Chitinophagales bacterium]|nr:helix-turn-helix domain-containing protein [Chitinophagales bacterium]